VLSPLFRGQHFAVFLRFPSLNRLTSVERSSHAVRPSTGCSRSTLPPSFAEAPLLGFRDPLQRHRICRLHLPSSHPRVLAHVHGFSPSSRAFFRSILPGLISSREHSWGSPFRGFPSDVAPSTHRRELPSCRSHGGHRSLARVPRTARSQRLGRLQGFPHRPSPFAVAGPVRAPPRPFPSWVSSSLGFVYRR